MLKIDRKIILLFILLISISFLNKYWISEYIIEQLEIKHERLFNIGLNFFLVLIMLLFLFRKTKVKISLKPTSKIYNIWYLLPFLLFFAYQSFSLDYDYLLSKKIIFILSTLFIIYIQCFVEEFIFRGLLINNYLIKGKGITKSVIFSAIIFGLSHSASFLKEENAFSVFNQIIIAVFIAVLLGALYVAIKNIYLLAFLHLLINLPAYINRIIVEPGSDAIINQVNNNSLFENMLSSFMIILLYSPILLLGLVIIYKVKKTHNFDEIKTFDEHPFLF